MLQPKETKQSNPKRSARPQRVADNRKNRINRGYELSAGPGRFSASGATQRSLKRETEGRYCYRVKTCTSPTLRSSFRKREVFRHSHVAAENELHVGGLAKARNARGLPASVTNNSSKGYVFGCKEIKWALCARRENVRCFRARVSSYYLSTLLCTKNLLPNSDGKR